MSSDNWKNTAERERLESLIRVDYERSHPDDTFDDLKRRSHFTKEDKGLLRDWMLVAAVRDKMSVPPRRAAA